MKRVALVTGGAKRIGAEICKHLHAEGFCIILHYKDSQHVAVALTRNLNASVPGSAISCRAQLNKKRSRQALVSCIRHYRNRLDLLVNNAAAFYATPPTRKRSSTKEWRDIIGTNLKAPYMLSLACHDFLMKTHGSIINITDIHGHKPLKHYPVYSISKAGIIMMTKALAREFAPKVRCNCISPGAILWGRSVSEDIRCRILKRTALKKPGCPRDIAAAVLYLATRADFITGQELTIDGGRGLRH